MSEKRLKILICRGPTCGGEHHSETLREALDELLAEQKIDGVEVGWQSCFGRCSHGPNLLVRRLKGDERTFALATMPRGRGRTALYSYVDRDILGTIVREHVIGGRVVREHLAPVPRPENERKKEEIRKPQVLVAVRAAKGGNGES